MENTPSKRHWFQSLCAGGLPFFLGFGGFILWFFARRTYRLVLRNENTILDTPTLFVCVGIVFSLFTVWVLWKLAKSQSWKIGWYGKKFGRSSHPSGALNWQDVIFCTIPGVVLGTIGLGWWVNCALDVSPPTIHATRVLRASSGVGAKNARHYLLVLKDWKNPTRRIEFPCSKKVYEAHKSGDLVQITTHQGRLGYEWTTDFKSR